MTSQNGDFTMRYSDLSLLPIVSGTAKCLVALAGPFSAAYLPIFNGPVFNSIVGIGAMSHTTLCAKPLLVAQMIQMSEQYMQHTHLASYTPVHTA